MEKIESLRVKDIWFLFEDKQHTPKTFIARRKGDPTRLYTVATCTLGFEDRKVVVELGCPIPHVITDPDAKLFDIEFVYVSHSISEVPDGI